MAHAPGHGVAEATPQHSWLDINGTKLAYREAGHGEPMVLIHGNVSDMRSWDGVESKLAERFRVIVYSRRYSWPNEPLADGGDDPWPAHADDLAVLIERLASGGPVHALGNSAGAFIALLLARRRPDLFRTLILEEPPVLTALVSHPWSFPPVLVYAATVIIPTTTAFKQGADEKGLEIFGRGALGSDFYAAMSDARLEQMRANLKPHRALLLGSGLPRFLEADARGIAVKTLVVMGAQTTGAHWHIAKRLAALIPGAKEAVIPNASHLSHEDNPSAVCEEILQFVGKNATTGGSI